MGASATRYRVEQEQASQAYTENATKEVRSECASRSDRATCEREIEEASREGQRNQKDLEAQRGMSDWAFWLLVISAFQFPATLAALVFVKRTLDATWEAVKDTGEATEAMRKSNLLGHPPHLLVNNVAVWKAGFQKTDLPDFVTGERIGIQVYVVNAGPDTATIKLSHCMAFWTAGPLPMIRPYNQLSLLTEFPRQRLTSGDYSHWEIETNVRGNMRDGNNLYVMGFLEYRGSIDNRRMTVFCRRYCPEEQRFVAVVNNPDYETQE